MYSHEVMECLKQVEFMLPKVAGAFEAILSVRVYDMQANINAIGLKDDELRKAATRAESPDYYLYSVVIDGVNVVWIEGKEGDDETV